jgi:Ca2+-binding RTX toxin-like protein
MGFLLFLLPVALLAAIVESTSSDDTSDDSADEGGDVQKGGAANNDLEGDGGDDLLASFGGDDTLTGAGGADLLVGDTGDDVLLGGDGVDLLLGGSGEDLLRGGEGTDLLIGGAGEDRLEGEAGNDILIDVTGSAEMEGGAGNDTLIGLTLRGDTSRFEDVTQLDAAAFLTEVEAQFGPQPGPFDQMLLRNLLPSANAPSFDTMSGGAGNDVLIGDAGDVMSGGAGADVFSAILPAAPLDPADPAFGQVVRVADFNPAEDQLEVQVESQGDVEIAVAERDQGVMVTVDGENVIFLPGLRADQVDVADILLSRL